MLREIFDEKMKHKNRKSKYDWYKTKNDAESDKGVW
jgi:hypothetical protein